MKKYSVLYFMLCVLAVTSVQAQDIDPEAVRQAIDRGITFLRDRQNANGSWQMEGHGDQRTGSTAIAVIAMRSCGVPPNDPSIQRAMQFLRAFSGTNAGGNYSLALQTMAFCLVDPARDLPTIRQNVALLERGQRRGGNEHSGGWHYTMDGGGSCLSNSQFTILALYEAERVGVQVSDATWRAALRYWSVTQNRDSGWGYTPIAGGGSGGLGGSTGSMTCAGIASLIISAGVADRGGAVVQGNNIICFQRTDSQHSQQIGRGIDWLANNFTVRQNPRLGTTWHMYYLYSLERVGRMTNQRFIGQHDWYRAGTEQILTLQVDGGHWDQGGYRISETAFALLFLSKGRRPVLMSKIQFGNDNEWNVHPNDVNNLTLFVESQPLWPDEMTWQIIDIRHATVDHLLQSPVISFSGRNWTIPPNEMQPLANKLREYIDQGGFIMAEAQSRTGTFNNTFRALMRHVFPEPGYELTLLDRAHPIWGAEIAIDPDHIRPIEGIQYGCRTSVVYIPAVEGRPSLSCLWEVYRHFNREGTRYPDVVQRQIDNGLGIGLNILAYATSRELRHKDEIRENVVRTDVNPAGRRGSVFIPYLDFGVPNPAPNAPRNLLFFLEAEWGIRIEHQTDSITLMDAALPDYPILMTHGRGTFTLSEEERRRLRTHLERGGFLFANSICSAEPFAVSFQSEMMSVFPNAQWERIPLSDPIFSDDYGGFRIESLEIRQMERTPEQGTMARTRQIQPELHGIRLSEDDRWVVVFSRHDISCALERTTSLECQGYTQSSALRLAANVILYALEHW